MRLFQIASLLLGSLVVTSCILSKEPRTKELIITLRNKVHAPLIEVHLQNAVLSFSKDDVNRILNKGLKSNLNSGTRRSKEKLKKVLSEPKERYVISSTVQVDELDGITSIIDKLLRGGKAIVRDTVGNSVSKIKMKEEFFLFGSYQKSFVFMDGREIIVTSVKFGE